MTSTAKEPEASRDFVKQSSLYQEFLAEREEILKHKWLESERLGHDIGFERALLDWIRKHREGWRSARRSQLQAQQQAAQQQGPSLRRFLTEEQQRPASPGAGAAPGSP